MGNIGPKGYGGMSAEDQAKAKFNPKYASGKEVFEVSSYHVKFVTVHDLPNTVGAYQSPAAWRVVNSSCKLEEEVAKRNFTRF